MGRETRETTTPKTTSQKWYESEGWKVFNQLLTYLETKHLDTVYIENFTVIEDALKKVPRKDIMNLFNLDSYTWHLILDNDGTLYAKKQ